MTLTLHRSDCTLWLGEALMASWTRWRFAPSPCVAGYGPFGFGKLRTASVAVAVDVPVGSRLVADARGVRRLATHFDAAGLDAGSVACMAGRGERGITWAGTASRKGA